MFWEFAKKRSELINLLPVLILPVLFTTLCFAEPIEIKAAVDRNKITIGDKVIFTIGVKYPATLKVQMPDPATSLTAFEIKDFEVKAPRKKWGKMQAEYRYVLTTFLTGEYRIEPIIFTCTLESGETKEVRTEPITITVESVKPGQNDRDDIRDIKMPVKIRTKIWLYTLIVFLILVFAGTGWYFYQQKKLRRGIFGDETAVNRSADEVAYERLAKLKETGLIAQGRIKEFYIILSEIIRYYLESRFRISVLDRTTAELYRELRKIEIAKQEIRMVKDFLDECDLVKFAKFIPEEEMILKDFDTAKEMVDRTRPEPVPEQAVQGNVSGQKPASGIKREK